MRVLKKNIGFIGLVLFSIIIVNKTDVAELSKMLEFYNPAVFALLSVLQIFTLAMTSYIWYFLCNSDLKRINFLKMFMINSAAGFIESITPSSKLGGEAAKIFLLKKHTKLSTARLSSLTLSKMIATFIPFLIINIIIFSGSFFLFYIPVHIFYSFLGLIFISVFLFSVYKLLQKYLLIKFGNNVLSEKVRNLLVKFLSIAENSKKEISKKNMKVLFSISTVEWLLYPVKVYIVARMLHIDASLFLIMLGTFSAYCVSVLPLTPGGLGTFEATMALVLSFNGVPFNSGLMLALSARLITFWLPLLISIICWMYYIFFDKFQNNEEKLSKIIKNSKVMVNYAID